MSETLQKVFSQEKYIQIYKLKQKFQITNSRLEEIYKQVQTKLQTLQTNQVILRQQNTSLHSALQLLKQKFSQVQNNNINARSELSKSINESNQLKDYIKKIKQVRGQQQKINQQLLLKVAKYKKSKMELQYKLNEKEQKIRILEASQNDPIADQLDKELQQLNQQLDLQIQDDNHNYQEGEQNKINK